MFHAYRPCSNLSASFHADRPEKSNRIDAKTFFDDSVAEFIGRTTAKERRRMKRWLDKKDKQD